MTVSLFGDFGGESTKLIKDSGWIFGQDRCGHTNLGSERWLLLGLFRWFRCQFFAGLA
jgi:hypothetical protein